MHYSILFSALAAAASAAPASSKVTYSSTEIVANFDALNALPSALLLSPLDTYKGLKYTNFGVDNLAVGLAGVAAHSVTNTAVFPGLNDGTLSVIYDKTSSASFDLEGHSQ